MIIDGAKYACEPCMRGHRSSKCNHGDRVLIKVRKPGRPLSTCPHDEGSCNCGSTRFAVPKDQNCPCPSQTDSHQMKGQTIQQMMPQSQGTSSIPSAGPSIGPIRTNGSFRDRTQSYGGQPYPSMMPQDRRRTYDGTDEPRPVVVKLPTQPGQPERIVLRHHDSSHSEILAGNTANGIPPISSSPHTGTSSSVSASGQNYTFHDTNHRYSAYDGQGGFSLLPGALTHTTNNGQSSQPSVSMPSYRRDSVASGLTSYPSGGYAPSAIGGMVVPFPNRMTYNQYTPTTTDGQNQHSSYFPNGSFGLNAAIPRQLPNPGYDNSSSNTGFVRSSSTLLHNAINSTESPSTGTCHRGSYSNIPDAARNNHCGSKSGVNNADGSDDTSKAGANEHNCACGPGCQCILCAKHPYNQSTLNYVRDLNTTIGTETYTGQDSGATDTSSALTFPNIEASSGSADTFNFHNSAPSANDINSNVDSGVDNGEQQDYVDNSPEAPASNYYHLNYPPSLYAQSDNLNHSMQPESDDPNSNQMDFAAFNMNAGNSQYDMGSNIQSDFAGESLGLGDEKVEFNESWEEQEE